jgi:hypothetical protein
MSWLADRLSVTQIDVAAYSTQFSALVIPVHAVGALGGPWDVSRGLAPLIFDLGTG